MIDWPVFFFVCGASLAAWLMYRTIQHKPELFSSENFLKSSKVLAVLAIALTAFIALVVNLLRG